MQAHISIARHLSREHKVVQHVMRSKTHACSPQNPAPQALLQAKSGGYTTPNTKLREEQDREPVLVYLCQRPGTKEEEHSSSSLTRGYADIGGRTNVLGTKKMNINAKYQYIEKMIINRVKNNRTLQHQMGEVMRKDGP